MKLSFNALIAGAPMLALVACVSSESIDETAGMPSRGGPFSEGLQAGYAELAHKEVGFHDWADAATFESKAAQAAMGETVLPADPRAWGVDGPDELDELVNQRAALMTVLDGGARSDMPALAARAQVMFDCWVEEAEEGPYDPGPVARHQPAQIALCKDAFVEAMEALTFVPLPVVAGRRPTEFAVHFEWDSAELSAEAGNQLDEIVDEVRIQRVKRVSVEGHADTSGTPLHNLDLSEKRARAVAAYLIAVGVDPDVIEVNWFGENMLAVVTADGVRERANRRTTVVLEK